MAEVGTVTFFNPQESKRFGFLRLESGDKIFFHFNDGRLIVPGEDSPVFSGANAFIHKGQRKPLPDPKTGDKIVFRRTEGRKGDKALPWGYEDNWLAAEQKIANRPVYRVRELRTTSGSEPGDPTVLWQGKNLSELNRKYPWDGSRKSADPLIPYWGDDDGLFNVRHWFEVQSPDGSWEECNDPRPDWPFS